MNPDLLATVSARATTAMDCDILCWDDEVDHDDHEAVNSVQAAAFDALPSSLVARWNEDGDLEAVAL